MNPVPSPYILPGLDREFPDMNLAEAELPLIMKVIENVTGVSIRDIKSKDRYEDVIFARHLFIGTAIANTNCTSTCIGNFINRERSTLSNSKYELKRIMQTIPRVAEQYKKIKEQLFITYNQQK